MFNRLKISVLTASMLCLSSIAHSEPLSTEMKFNALGIPLSAFKIRQMKAKGITNPQGKAGVELKATLTLPKGEGPFPAVILNHDCRGVLAFHKQYAKTLANWGYASFLIDTYGPRGVKAGSVCPNIAKWDTKDFISSRTSDIYGALKLLKSMPKIDGARIALMGWDRDSTMSAVAKQGMAAQNADLVPKAAISIYPDCRRMSSGEFAVPIMIIAAGKDDWWPAVNCLKLKAASGKARQKDATFAKVKLVHITAAQHGFDDPSVGEKMVIADAFNPNKTPILGATFAYDKTSTGLALGVLKDYLATHLK